MQEHIFPFSQIDILKVAVLEVLKKCFQNVSNIAKYQDISAELLCKIQL